MTTNRRPQRSTPPPIPQLKRDPASSTSSPNITMPLDTRDIIEALDPKPDDEQPPPR